MLILALLAPIVGAASGLIGAVFRLALAEADRLRDAAIVWAHGWKFGGLLIIAAGCAAAVAFAAWLVRRFSPYASGSGIPQVEAILQDKLPPTPPRLLLVKFFGGLSAIGAGLALGREGPSVQMGAAVAHIVAKISGRNWLDCKVLIAAGAGAGLATAFNAPIAGAVFVLEELVRRFDTRIAIAALGASAAAIAVARVFLGAAPDFTVEPLAYVGVQVWPLFVGLGAVAGLAGNLYNGALLGTLATMDRLSRWPIEIRAAVIGAAVGALGFFAPALIGGGDDITQRILTDGAALATASIGFSAALWARRSVVCGAGAGRSVCPASRAGGAARAVLRRPLPIGPPGCGPRPDRFRRRRHGGVFHRGGAGSGYRHRARRRDDRQLHDAIADDRGVLCGNAGAQPVARRPDLRFAARAAISIAAVRRSFRRYSNGSCTSRK